VKNIRVLVPARRAHAPIEYAVMSASGAERTRPGNSRVSAFEPKRTLAQRPGLLMNPTRPSAAYRVLP
jgi:hypothetical protein